MELQTCIHTHTPGEYLEVRGKSTLYFILLQFLSFY